MKKLKQCQWKLFYLYLSYFTLFYVKLFKQSAAVSDSMEATEQSILYSGLEIMSIITFKL